MLERLYSILHCQFVKNRYRLISVGENEEIYYSNNKIEILVNSEEIGRRLRSTISIAKTLNIKISYGLYEMSIIDYTFINDRITSFTVKISGSEDVISFVSIWDMGYDFENDELVSFVGIITALNEVGFNLIESRFEFKRYRSISEILSLVGETTEDEECTKGLLIKYCNYFFSGTNNFDEVYSKVDKELFFSNFSYYCPFEIIKMCYNYHSKRIVPYSVYEVVISAMKEKSSFEKYLISTSDAWRENLSKKDIFASFENIKLFTNMSEDVIEQLIDDTEIEDTYNDIIVNKVFDLNWNLIGVNVSKKEINETAEKSIINYEPEDIASLWKRFEQMFYIIEKLLDFQLENHINPTECNVNIFESFVISADDCLRIGKIERLVEIISMPYEEVENQVANIFLEMLKKIIERFYGKFRSENDLFKVSEVRNLRPIIAKTFSDFYFGKEVNKEILYSQLVECILVQDTIKITNGNVWDTCFITNPLEVPFSFDYEIKKKYGLNLSLMYSAKKEFKKELPDGRTLVVLAKPKRYKEICGKYNNNVCEMSEKIGNVENDRIKYIKISELIYRRKQEDYDEYECVGYITTPCKGIYLSENAFCKMNNKELMYFFGYYVSNFIKYDLPYKVIKIGKNDIFYIDLLSDSFEVQHTKCTTKGEYIKKQIIMLVNMGVSENEFISVNLLCIKNYSKYFIELAKSMTNYCEEHKIYYPEEKCPVCTKVKLYVGEKVLKDAKIIFEDRIAKHIEYDSKTNLKIYKPEAVNMLNMEERVDEILGLKEGIYEKQYMQDCFIPRKKVIEESRKKFIGYTYERICFDLKTSSDEKCIDLEDTLNLKSLPRLKSLIRLVTQVKELIKNDLFFDYNPYGNVHLNRNHKKQVQITNIEFADKNGDKLKTAIWTYQYVQSIIRKDKSLRALLNEDDSKKIPSKKNSKKADDILEELLNNLQNIESNMSAYCVVHGMYYNEKVTFCPKCSNEIKKQNISVRRIEKKELEKLNELNEGGESIIYNLDDNFVIKIFKKEEVNLSLKSSIITQIIKRSKELEEDNQKNLKCKYILPKTIVIDEDNKLYGYTMRGVNGHPISVLKDKRVVENIGFTKKDILEMLIEVGNGIERLHTRGIFFGDLNGRNILFDESKNIYFLDLDGMGVENIVPEFYTDGYIDPISKNNQVVTPKDDWYSFAIQAFYYLTYTHPFNGIYKENGEKLDIPTKMEKRISLLGSHGMNPPALSDGWYWMENDLRKVFLDIFEGDARINIVPYLIKQRDIFKKEKNELKINSKFVAKIIDPFEDTNGKLMYVVNSIVAIYLKDNKKYAIVLKNGHKHYIRDISYTESFEKIKSIEISANERFAFIVETKRLLVIDLKEEKCVKKVTLKINDNVVLNKNTIYYMEYSNEERVIAKMACDAEGGMHRERIRIDRGMECTKNFSVKFNKKFVLVKKADDQVDEIFCNDEKFCEIRVGKVYKFFYDDITKTWLIINENGYMVMIRNDGTFLNFKINNFIPVTLEGSLYENGNLYIPNENELWIANLKEQCKNKSMECQKIMTQESKICKIMSDGFVVLTDQIIYKVSIKR